MTTMCALLRPVNDVMHLVSLPCDFFKPAALSSGTYKGRLHPPCFVYLGVITHCARRVELQTRPMR
jgi:hypothetical protein